MTLDPLHLQLDLVAEAPAATAAALQSRTQYVELVVVAAQAPDGQEALENLAEAGKEPRADQADDLAREALVRPFDSLAAIE